MLDPTIFKKFEIAPPLFVQYMEPLGGLTKDRVTHACFYYYVLARKNYEENKDAIVMEGDEDPQFDFFRLFKSIAAIYAIEPEKMANAWAAVDLTCMMHNLPKLPNERRYRHDFKAEVIQ